MSNFDGRVLSKSHLAEYISYLSFLRYSLNLVLNEICQDFNGLWEILAQLKLSSNRVEMRNDLWTSSVVRSEDIIITLDFE